MTAFDRPRRQVGAARRESGQSGQSGAGAILAESRRHLRAPPPISFRGVGQQASEAIRFKPSRPPSCEPSLSQASGLREQRERANCHTVCVCRSRPSAAGQAEPAAAPPQPCARRLQFRQISALLRWWAEHAEHAARRSAHQQYGHLARGVRTGASGAFYRLLAAPLAGSLAPLHAGRPVGAKPGSQ